MATPRILYCHCQYAQVLPKDAKEEVLRKLCESGVDFEAVADLCDLSARKDPLLHELASGGDNGGALKISACYPRAVKWLFAAAGAPLDPAQTEVRNLRTESAAEALAALLIADIQPNLPASQRPRSGDNASAPTTD